MSFSLKESQTEKERFSSSMFNLKHFFGNENCFINTFEIKLLNVFVCEPFEYKITHLYPDEYNNKNCFLSFEIENILTKDISVQIVDSDILLELASEIMNGKFVKIQSNLLNMTEYQIFNKNNFSVINSFEKTNLLGKISIDGNLKTEIKYDKIIENCHFCSKKNQIMNEKSVSRFSKKEGDQSVYLSVTAINTYTGILIKLKNLNS